MATKRREAVIRMAGLLEIEIEPGEGTAELMERCIAEIEGQRAELYASKLEAAEADDQRDEAEAQGERAARGAPALSLVPEPEQAGEQSPAFELANPTPRRGKRKRAAQSGRVIPPVRRGFTYSMGESGEITESRVGS